MKALWFRMLLSLHNYILAEMLHHVNVPSLSYTGVYDLKTTILNRYGALDGLDGQRVVRRCWYCENGCDNCEHGIYRIDYVELRRIRLGKRVFHIFHQKLRVHDFYVAVHNSKYVNIFTDKFKKPYRDHRKPFTRFCLKTLKYLFDEEYDSEWSRKTRPFVYKKITELERIIYDTTTKQ